MTGSYRSTSECEKDDGDVLARIGCDSYSETERYARRGAPCVLFDNDFLPLNNVDAFLWMTYALSGNVVYLFA